MTTSYHSPAFTQDMNLNSFMTQPYPGLYFTVFIHSAYLNNIHIPEQQFIDPSLTTFSFNHDNDPLTSWMFDMPTSTYTNSSDILPPFLEGSSTGASPFVVPDHLSIPDIPPPSSSGLLFDSPQSTASSFDYPNFFDLSEWASTSGLTNSPASSMSSLSSNTTELKNTRLPSPTSSSTTTSSASSPASSPLDSFDSKSDAPQSHLVSPTEKDYDHRRRFRCLHPQCTRRFTSQYTLKVHMDAHRAKPRVPLPCTLGCSERFSRRHDRLRHEVSQHGKVCEFVCDDCGRFFSSAKTLGNHKCPTARGKTRWVK